MFVGIGYCVSSTICLVVVASSTPDGCESQVVFSQNSMMCRFIAYANPNDVDN